jgi:hypothetical protein
VAIFREVHYKEQIHRNITEVFEPMHGSVLALTKAGLDYDSCGGPLNFIVHRKRKV